MVAKRLGNTFRARAGVRYMSRPLWWHIRPLVWALYGWRFSFGLGRIFFVRGGLRLGGSRR